MDKKKFYESPATEILEIQIKNSILEVSYPGNTIDPASLDQWGEEL